MINLSLPVTFLWLYRPTGKIKQIKIKNYEKIKIYTIN